MPFFYRLGIPVATLAAALAVFRGLGFHHIGLTKSSSEETGEVPARPCFETSPSFVSKPRHQGSSSCDMLCHCSIM